MKVKSYAKKEFLKFLDVLGIDDNTVEQTNEYFICIDNYWDNACPFDNKHYNTISLQFDDVLTDEYKDIDQGKVYARCMKQHQAEQLFNFIDNIPDDASVRIYCSHGESRSVAVRNFIDSFRNNIPTQGGNSHVRKMLDDVLVVKGRAIEGKKRYIRKYDEANLGWKIKKWFPVDVEKLREWFDTLERDYGDWKFVVGENEHVWKNPIIDPEGKTGHMLKYDTAYYTLCWNDDSPGPKPFEQGNAKPEYQDNDNDELNPRKCFTGYGLDIVQSLPVRSKKWLVTMHSPGTKLITHQDAPDKIRVHIPIHTNADSNWVIGDEEYHMEVGWAYLVNTTIPHSVENKGYGYRIHLYGKVWTDDIKELNL